MNPAGAGDEETGQARSGPHTSGLAVAALLLPVLSLPLAILIIWTWGRLTSAWPSLAPPDSVGVAWTALVVSLLSLILAIVALARILRYRERLAGTTRAIEAIIVSALVALVWLMLLPVMSRAQESGRMALCMSNVDDLMRGIEMYLEDNDQSFPQASVWCDAIKPYHLYDESFVCPDARRLKCGYAFSSALSSLQYEKVVTPEKTAAIFESGRGWNASGGADLLPAVPRHWRFHDLGTDMWGFADGHVTRLRREETVKPGVIQWQPQPEPK